MLYCAIAAITTDTDPDTTQTQFQDYKPPSPRSIVFKAEPNSWNNCTHNFLIF